MLDRAAPMGWREDSPRAEVPEMWLRGSSFTHAERVYWIVDDVVACSSECAALSCPVALLIRAACASRDVVFFFFPLLLSRQQQRVQGPRVAASRSRRQSDSGRIGPARARCTAEPPRVNNYSTGDCGLD